MLSSFSITIVACCWMLAIDGDTQSAANVGRPAAEQPAQDATEKPPAPSVADQRAALAEQLRMAQLTLDSAKQAAAENSTKPPELLQREVELLKLADLLLAQQQAGSERLGEQTARKAELEGQLRAMQASGPNEPRPFSFLLLDQSRDELTEKKNRDAGITDKVNSSKEALRLAREVYEEKERLRRQAKETGEKLTDEAAKAEAAAALKVAEIDSRVASETVKLRELELSNEDAASQLHTLSVQLLDAKIHWLQRDATFSQRDIDDQLAELDLEESQLSRELDSIQLGLTFLEQQWMEEQQHLTAATDDKALLAERLETLRLARQTKRLETNVLNWRLQAVTLARSVWIRRFQLSSGQIMVNDRHSWQSETERAIAQLDRERRLNANQIDELRRDQANLDKRAQANKDRSPEFAHEMAQQRDSIQTQIRVLDSLIVAIESSRRLHEKLLNEITGEAQSLSTAERIAAVKQRVMAIWNYEVMSVDDRPITIGKVIGGLVLLVLGFWLSRWLSRMLGKRLLPRVGVHESAASALQSVVFYCFVATFTMMALRVVSVPLTLFTFLGGAVAIGVGFGSQNIMNNFISGLILLAERPVRVGDTIELEGLRGRVVQIGARSTRVLTADNLEIIVPNSTFLEKNVTNWTLSDTQIRTKIAVGVAYGSPTREVARLLNRAAIEHGQVLDNPEPAVRFVDFGDNALVFELHVWIRMRSIAERMRIESDLRFRIESLFNEGGIVIAFPQRDLHIDSEKPLEIRMVRSAAAQQPGQSVSSRAA